MTDWVLAGELLAQTHEMTTRNVTCLMGEHADDLVRRFRLHQRAGIDENAAAVGDEGVEAAVVDDDDLDVLFGKSGRLQDRLHVFAQQLLDLGIADDRRAAGTALLRRRRRMRGDERNRGDAGKQARRQPVAARPRGRSVGPSHLRLELICG
jgi:hypothetical protein